MKKCLIILVCLLFLSLSAGRPSWSESAEEYYFKANMSLTSGNIQESVRLYKLAAESRTDFYEAYLGLSIAYRELKDYEKAHEAILKVLEIRPDYYQVYYNLGLILEKQGKYRQAVKAYDKFLKKVPGAANFTDVKQRISRMKQLLDK